MGRRAEKTDEPVSNMYHPWHEQRPHQEKGMYGPGHTKHEAITDITDEVHAKVASCMRGSLVLQLPTMDDNSGSDDEATTPAPRKGASNLERSVPWIQQYFTRSPGHTRWSTQAECEKMSVTLFISGFMMVMARENNNIKPFIFQHQQELMEDADLYAS